MTMRATMTPRRLPLPPDLVIVRPDFPCETEGNAAAPGLLHKACALALHVACLWLFWVLVVSPIVSSVRSGELEREFRPLLDAARQMVADGARRHGP